MKLRFSVDQAEAFRQGIDAPKSTMIIEVNPADLTPEIRGLIADRMDGIDVHPLRFDKIMEVTNDTRRPGRSLNGPLIMAKLPTFEALLEAIQENEAKVVAEEKAFNPSRSFKPREQIGNIPPSITTNEEERRKRSMEEKEAFRKVHAQKA